MTYIQYIFFISRLRKVINLDICNLLAGQVWIVKQIVMILKYVNDFKNDLTEV